MILIEFSDLVIANCLFIYLNIKNVACSCFEFPVVYLIGFYYPKKGNYIILFLRMQIPQSTFAWAALTNSFQTSNYKTLLINIIKQWNLNLYFSTYCWSPLNYFLSCQNFLMAYLRKYHVYTINLEIKDICVNNIDWFIRLQRFTILLKYFVTFNGRPN